MKVRSGFKQKRSAARNIKQLSRFLGRRIRSLLSTKVFQLKSDRFFSSSSRLKQKSYLRKDIHKKDFENPYSKKAKTSTKVLARLLHKHRFKISFSLLFILLSAWGTVVFARPTFYLNRVQVHGLQDIPESDIITIAEENMKSRSLTLVKRSHLLFLSESRIEEKIREKYGIESIEFKTHWPSRLLSIHIKEKSSVLAYSVGDNYYTIDRTGVIIKQLSPDNLEEKAGIPIIYNYGNGQPPQIGDNVLEASNIETVIALYQELQKYPQVKIHSFRLIPAPKREVVIPEKTPDITDDSEDIIDETEEQIDKLAASIAQAKSPDEKLEQIRELLSEIDIKKIEAGELERYLEQEKVYRPDDSVQFNELELYTINGWSIKLGSTILDHPETVQTYLDIFATLTRALNIEGEVKEYIDLRFPGRIYYR